MSVLPVETVRLASGTSEVHLAPERGGMVTRFVVGDDPVLYLDEATLGDATKNVRGGVPILFPIGGKLAPDTLPGATAPMKQHGFARNLPWQVASAADDRAVLTLEASDTTRAMFPHDFALAYTYTLADGALTIEQRFHNRGAEPMAIQPGLHPYFYVKDKGGAYIETDATRAWDNVGGADVEFRGVDFTTGEIDMHLLDHGPHATRLHRHGLPGVALEWSADQHVVVLWTLPGKPFICVEPWSAPANALHRSGGIVVAPGADHTSWVKIAAV